MTNVSSFWEDAGEFFLREARDIGEVELTRKCHYRPQHDNASP